MDKIAPLLAVPAIVIATPVHAEIERYAAFINEASERFDVPIQWIEAVITVESSGNPSAVSPKGAMSLMQVMPATFRELRKQHNLGPDPFDPRTNILAGTAYLKAMHDAYGYPGCFAAYNAGPGRYENHKRTGKPLPQETRDYVKQLVAATTSHPNSNTDKTPESHPERAVIVGQKGLEAIPEAGDEPPGYGSSGPLFFPLRSHVPDSAEPLTKDLFIRPSSPEEDL